MNVSDFFAVLQWWVVIGLIGITFFPLTSFLFSKSIDKGYVFSKIIGIFFLSYLVFILGILHILPFHLLSVVFLLILSAVANYTFNFSFNRPFIQFRPQFKGFFSFSKNTKTIILIEELLFLIGLFFWSYVRAHQPDIHGLEKYMDFGFVNSILKSDFFPPKDMWFTPFSINYYYFGHFVTAVLTKLSLIPSSITFNLMLATIFAFTFVGSFSIGLALKKMLDEKPVVGLKNTIITALLCAGLVTFAGNLHALYTFFTPYQNDKPVPLTELKFSPGTYPNNYWYPNATRFIYNTIHEFPIYSFVVSDLHGHVLSIPLVLLIIALLLHEFKTTTKKLQLEKFVFVSLLLSWAYMTNAWDGIIYFLLLALILIILKTEQLKLPQKKLNIFQRIRIIIRESLPNLALVGFALIIFVLPFSLTFKPFVSGIGVLCAPDFLTKMGRMGPFLFEPDHCQKSPPWQLLMLYGFFYIWVFSYLIYIFKKKFLLRSQMFILFLILLSTFLIIIPEFIYAKDIYPAHYRANTMFKLVYQSFIMLSLVSGYIIVLWIEKMKTKFMRGKNRIVPILFFILTSFLLYVVFSYPVFAIRSYYGDLKTSYQLDGTTYLKNQYPNDYEATVWMNNTISNQPVILEAQGDSYTDYARVSTNTGLPTVLGWTVHEWLWRGSYGIPAPRIAEIQTLYESKDLQETKALIKKYNIEYVFFGDLEKQKYPNANEEKFKKLGNIVFQKGQTKIYKITSSQ